MQMVNGYQCRNCTDVSYAKKNIDPAHPKDGPVDGGQAKQAAHSNMAVEFGGILSALRASNAVTNDNQGRYVQVPRPGALLSVVT
jgi:N-acyl-D-aspartate/D-glutamate deacylase